MSSLLKAAVLFFIYLFFFIASLIALLSIDVPLPQQLSMKLTISLLLKNTIGLLFFSEHKLYGFPQSDVLRIGYHDQEIFGCIYHLGL